MNKLDLKCHRKFINHRFLKQYDISKTFQDVKLHIPIKMEDFLMQKYPFIPARNFSFIYLKILYKDFLMKPRVRRFFLKMFEDFIQNK